MYKKSKTAIPNRFYYINKINNKNKNINQYKNKSAHKTFLKNLY